VPQVLFNEESCKGCKLCITVCPKKIISLSSEVNSHGFHPAKITGAEKCTGCGFCFLVCPDIAITVLRGEGAGG